MAHSRQNYKFPTEEEAKQFADEMKRNKTPDQDLYVYGPMYMDKEEIFKGILGNTNKEKFWQISVEIYQ